MSVYLDRRGQPHILVAVGLRDVGVKMVGVRNGVVRTFMVSFTDLVDEYQVSTLSQEFVAQALLRLGEQHGFSHEAYVHLYEIVGEAVDSPWSLATFLNMAQSISTWLQQCSRAGLIYCRRLTKTR